MRYLLYICIALFLSCGTSKRSTDVKRHMSTSVSLSDSLLRKDSVLSLEQLLSNERLHAHVIVTEWSIPDSTGLQFPLKTTEVEISNDRSHKSTKSEKIVSTADRIKKEEIKKDVQESKVENLKSDTRFIPSRMWWFLIIGGVIMALLMWHSRRKK